MDIELRPIEPRDMKKCIALLARELSPFAPSETELPAIWSTFVSQPHVHSVVACCGEEVLGYGSIVIETKIRGGKLAHVEDICTCSSARRQGIGRKILDALTTIARAQGCYKMALACQAKNLEFYSASGYTQDGASMSQFLK